MKPSALKYRLVQRSVRPPRAVTLVKISGDWRADLLRMLECYSRTWGGDGNGLVAIPDSWQIAEPFWSLLPEFDADHWFAFRQTRRGLRMSDAAAYEAMVDADVRAWLADHDVTEEQAREMFEDEQFLSDSSAFRLPEEIGERIRHFMAPLSSRQVTVHATFKADEPPPHGLVDMCQLTYRPIRTMEVDFTGLPPSVQLLVASRTGVLAPRHSDHLRAGGAFNLTKVAVELEELSQLLEFSWTGKIDALLPRLRHLIGDFEGIHVDPEFSSSRFLEDTPLVQSRLGCSWFSRMHPNFDEEPVVVVCGDSAVDFTYAYTRQRTIGDTYWLPVGPEDKDEVHQVLLETLSRVLSTFAKSPAGNRPVIITSLTLTNKELDALLARLSETIWGRSFNTNVFEALSVTASSPNDLPVLRRLILLDSVHFGDTFYEPFLDAELARTIEIPLPSEARGLRPESFRWQVDLEVPDNILPARWILNPILAVKNEQSGWAIRSSKSGTSIDSHGRGFFFGGSSLSQMLVQVRPRFPDATEIFSTLLAASGATIEESDKGRYSRRMVEMWGSFSRLAEDMRTGPIRKLLSSWCSETVVGDHGRIHQSRKYLRLSDVSGVTGLTVENAREILDFFQQRLIVTRGLVLKCNQCMGTSFYRVEEIGQTFRCQRCRQDNELARATWKGSEEPEWFYGLDEVAHQGLRSNAHVPILALSELAGRAKSFLYMPECVVHRPGLSNMEIDIWAVIDGRIIVGEAKSTDHLESTAKLEKKRCAAFRDLANVLSADEFVMATSMSSWSQRSKRNVDEIISPFMPVKWLHNLE